jgi:hypothetical protein
MFCNMNMTVFLDKDRTMDNVRPETIFVLMYHRHKNLDPIYSVLFLNQNIQCLQ